MITDIKVLDNFYIDPNRIISLVDNFPITGCGSGARTIDLCVLDSDIFQSVKESLCNIHNVDHTKIKLFTFFMEHFYNDMDELFNIASTHMDGKDPDICRSSVEEYNLAFCGQILLTSNPDPETGVAIYKFKPHINWNAQEIVKHCIDDYTIPGEEYRAGRINLETFKEMRNAHEENFELTCDIKNVFNRMVSWKGGTLHGQKITKNVPRKLNQYFFAEWI